MIRFKQRNTFWLAAISALTAIALIAGNVASGVEVLLLGLLAFAVAGSFIHLEALFNSNLVEALQQRTPLTAGRHSPQAREALARATSRGAMPNSDIDLIDIGLITAHSGEEGMVMRRSRTITKDEDGVRPFVTFDVDPSAADRNARLRFEFVDQHGESVYVHEMDVYLRDGEINIVADHQLPLQDNDKISGMGDWDLRVYLDSRLAGIHGFSLSPSYEEKRSRLSGGGRPRHYVIPSAEVEAEEAEEDVPLSLEELLRDQSNQSRR